MSEMVIWMFAALGGEILLLLLVLLAFSWFRNRAAGRRDREAIQGLVTRIKNARNEREAAIGRFLDEQIGMSGDALMQAKSAMLLAEMVLLQRFANIYGKRDALAAAQFDDDITAVLAPYHELRGGGEAVAVEPGVADPSELNALRAENKSLSDELSVTMGTISRMLNEYSTMFVDGAPGESAPVAAPVGASAADAGETEESPDVTPENDPGDDIDVLFAEAEADPVPPVAGRPEAAGQAVGQEPPGMAGDDAVDDVAGEPLGIAAEKETTGHEAADAWEVSVVESPAPLPLETGQGDELDGGSGFLGEGTVEAMAFDDADEFDVDPVEAGDDLFDSAEPETIARAGAALDAAGDSIDDGEVPNGEELFDAGDEPLRTQSGG
ncbi:MAG: hypothetical protein WBM67_07615 [Sedimenticolaceae bacterium]